MSNLPATNETATSPSDPNQSPPKNPKDCLPCRIVGATALVGTGLYGLGAARPGKPGSPLERRIMGVVGVGFILAGIGRAIF
ncbi:hypothetical protein M407DRAFT_20025 [Tulasnella calospora MUT 4182]|uniref:Distal membrane-arm assembly complex protein 1-like domain-containing protein n=1 Tax=Tulasnella calospora MUT 4182 TaxID=1051891 RepID=A0A0C3LAK1_9AGAM|nr:hypothetical protein M407DRAFT_20025 [Tulasnella calospora MUT 4182]